MKLRGERKGVQYANAAAAAARPHSSSLFPPCQVVKDRGANRHEQREDASTWLPRLHAAAPSPLAAVLSCCWGCVAAVPILPAGWR